MQTTRLLIALKALRQLGPTQVALNAVYKFGLATGHYRRAIRPPAPVNGLRLKPILTVPERGQVISVMGESGLRNLLAEADEIVAGNFRQFGAQPVPIQLIPERPLAHWTEYETGKIPHKNDIKFTWEPARFGWAFVLGRAYHASGDEKYADAFWRYFLIFITANPAYQGPNWTSGQEVGLRLMAFVWAAQIFAGSKYSSAVRLSALAQASAAHAARIPATLVYARSQNNNHILTEAAALYTAGLALPAHPDSARWIKTGRKWLGWCFSTQIDAQGEYVQHSANYQRLMLQTALWVNALDMAAQPTQPVPGSRPEPAVYKNRALDEPGRKNLALAAKWLIDLLDPAAGRIPNLGANDGALILPLSGCDFSDFRPVAQAAAWAFLAKTLPPGAWDEMPLWFGLAKRDNPIIKPDHTGSSLDAPNSWCYLRAVTYKSRPSHADQLHLDLWWRGLNIAQDAGTYLYNAAPPWDNSLTSSLVHNTVSLDGQDQMTRASRFLYLDWANAAYGPHFESGLDYFQLISAETDAYARFKINHERLVTVFKEERWLVEDKLRSAGSGTAAKSALTPAHTYRLHWLLPDWGWQLQQKDAKVELRLQSPHGWVNMVISASQPVKRVAIIRAGELLQGDGLLSPAFGWISPTYGIKIPAISLAVEVQSEQNILFSSEFVFPNITQPD
jgi:hypothetical protein